MKRTAASVSLLLIFLGVPRVHASAPDSLGRDSLATDSARVVRTLTPVLVRASRLDVLSAEARRAISAEALRTLPLDRPADALALEPGVVVEDDVVHVRGGRPGELRVELDGLGMNEPFRGEPPLLPVGLLDGLELVRGGREADLGGGLAGTLVARPLDPRARWSSRLLEETSGGGSPADDRLVVRTGGPVAHGLSFAIGGEAHLDDASLPDLRSSQRIGFGLPIGWRGRNEAAAIARVAAVRAPERFAVTALVSRRLLRPFHPEFALDGWATPCADPDCRDGPAFSPTEIDTGGYARYDAADHFPITDVRRTAVIASSAWRRGPDSFQAALGWNLERRLVSVGGAGDPFYVTAARAPFFGVPGSATSDPFHVYAGDAPYFRRSRAEWLEARADWRHEWPSGSAIDAGLDATHERVSSFEIDDAFAGYDSLRAFRASAPGAAGWLSARWVNEGLIANLGVRTEWFDPGPQAATTLHTTAPHGIVLVSPRIGLSFPLSVHDAVQAAYERIQQAPGREFLYDDRIGAIDPRHPLGNPQLGPATAISWETVLRHRANARWSGSAGFFWRDLGGEVGARTFRLPNGATALRYESADVGHALGLELTIARDDPGRSRLAATCTWMQAQGSESIEEGVPAYPLLLAQPPPIAEHPLAWDEPLRLALAAFRVVRGVRVAWTTVIASGRRWTPAAIRQPAADLSLTNARHLPLYSLSDLSLSTGLPRLGPTRLGVDVRNVFDFRGARRVSIDGWPNAIINTQYDDYAAHRAATGQGAAYWDDTFGWVGVDDPRLDFAPREVRLLLEAEW